MIAKTAPLCTALGAAAFTVVVICELASAQTPRRAFGLNSSAPASSASQNSEGRNRSSSSKRTGVEPVELHAIAIYEPASVWQRTKADTLYREKGTVRVRVKASPSPIALLLSMHTHQDAIWHIDLEPGAEVAQVIIGGSSGQDVQGLPKKTRILDQTSKYWLNNSPFRLPTRKDHPRFDEVRQAVKELVGLDMYSFQSTHDYVDYPGSEFVVQPGPLPSKQALRNARLHAIGLYEGAYKESLEERGKRRFEDPEPYGSANVKVEPSSKPIVLVLMGYEPIMWTIEPHPDASILLIILGGYRKQSVVGQPPETPVIVRNLGNPPDIPKIVRHRPNHPGDIHAEASRIATQLESNFETFQYEF